MKKDKNKDIEEENKITKKVVKRSIKKVPAKDVEIKKEEKKVSSRAKRESSDKIEKELKLDKANNNVEDSKKIVDKKKEEKKEVKVKQDFVKKSVEFNLLEVILIILITGVLVSVLSGFIIYNNYDKLNPKNSVVCSSDEKFKELEENYNTIINNYVDEVDKNALIDAAISGMYNYLGDANTFYVDKSSNDTLQDTLNGEYEGIGVEITTSYKEDGSYNTYISRVFKDSAASRAGLLEGDVLLELNGIDLSDKDSSYVADTIKNGAQTENTIVVLRNNEKLTLNIVREHIYIDSVHSEVKDGVGYIQLETFSLTTADQVKKAIDGFDSSVKSLVIDLRDNGGGYTVSAFDTANLFIEEGKNIYQMKDRNDKFSIYKADTGVYRKFNKIAVLVNGSSASSSEIVALALKESANATIVGTKSFGKGSVQETKQLSSGAMVKYTIAYWLSPKGNSINNIGIIPDIVEENVDNQINAAINAVK